MAKFFKNLFSTVRVKDDDPMRSLSKSSKDITNIKDNTNNKDNSNNKDNNINSKDKDNAQNYGTQKKMSISRSGRMKHNAKLRGKLNDELYGKEVY